MKLEEQTKKLLKIKPAIEIEPGDVEIDHEIHKIVYNLEILSNIIALCGEERAKAKYDLYKAQETLAEAITESELKIMGVVKSNKFELIKRKTAKEAMDLETWENRELFFKNRFKVYQEYLMAYKKTRSLV